MCFSREKTARYNFARQYAVCCSIVSSEAYDNSPTSRQQLQRGNLARKPGPGDNRFAAYQTAVELRDLLLKTKEFAAY